MEADDGVAHLPRPVKPAVPSGNRGVDVGAGADDPGGMPTILACRGAG